jgi:hypothetical protein
MIGLSHTCALRQRLECSVCQQTIEGEKVRSGEINGVLFGHAPYAICCCCHQEVHPDDAKDRNYRARWRRWYRKLVQDGQVTCTGEDTKILTASRVECLKE